MRTAPRRTRQSGAWMTRIARVQGIWTWADPTVLSSDLGRLPHGPTHDQIEPDDRDLQDHHQPDESPGIHLTLILYPPCGGHKRLRDGTDGTNLGAVRVPLAVRWDN